MLGDSDPSTVRICISREGFGVGGLSRKVLKICSIFSLDHLLSSLTQVWGGCSPPRLFQFCFNWACVLVGLSGLWWAIAKSISFCRPLQ